MRRGKEIAQGAHAAMLFLTDQIDSQATDSHPIRVEIVLSAIEASWLQRGFAKVCLRVESEDELLHYHQQALARGLTSKIVTDSGRTEFGGQPTRTACAIGPAASDDIDSLTGTLTPY